MIEKKNNIEEYLWNNYRFISGTDEAGRGSLVGPIIVSSVIMPMNFSNSLIKDSKLLSSNQRNFIFEIIKKEALAYSIIFVDKEQIELKNPSVATKESMIISLKELKITPKLCLIDGRDEIISDNLRTLSIIKGDNNSINISAASILAKVTRDNYMKKIHDFYPQYNWFENKGYANKNHLLAIYNHGICELHRKNYEPIKSILEGKESKNNIFKKYKLI